MEKPYSQSRMVDELTVLNVSVVNAEMEELLLLVQVLSLMANII